MYTKALGLSKPIWQRINTKILFFILAATFVSIFLLYAYLVNKTIMNVVARQHTEKSISALSSKLGDLEAKYLALQGGVTIDLAYARGFKDANPQFISRSGVVAYNTAQ